MTITLYGADLEQGAIKAASYAHAEGQLTNATASYSHAEGYACWASGTSSHAEGQSTNANNPYSHSEGTGTNASANAAHAEGNATTAAGGASHAEGQGSTAAGQNSHAEGTTTLANASAAHAEGSNTTASGLYSHAGGNYGKADSYGSWARGSVQPSVVGATRAQYATYAMGILTTNTVNAVLTMDGSGTINTTGSGANVMVIPPGATYVYNISLAVRRAAASQAFTYSVILARDVGGSARLVGTVTQIATAGDTTLGTVTISANTSGQYLQIMVLPQSTAATSWHAVVQVNELVTGT